MSGSNPASPQPPQDPAVISYKSLRRCLGLLGFALPTVLLFATRVDDRVSKPMPGSISSFYYTHMGPYLIGTLCALGIFLFCYRYATTDNWLSNVAGVAVTFVALCPTERDGVSPTLLNNLHLIAAATFFAVVAVFSAFVFTQKPDQVHWWDPWRQFPRATPEDKRDWVYRICAILIILPLVVAAVIRGGSLFWGESVAVFAFSFSWMVKGEFRWLWRWEVFPDTGALPPSGPARLVPSPHSS